MSRLHHVVQCMQYCRMKLLIELCHLGVVSINSQHVLNQVITANRQEVDATNDIPRLINRRWYLDHDTYVRHFDFNTFLNNFSITARNQSLSLVNFRDAGDHRQHDSQLSVDSFVSSYHGAYLGQENLRVI